MPSPADQAVLEALSHAFAARGRICTARADPGGGVAILFYEHQRGYWRHDPSGFVFAPDRTAESTYRCSTLAEAVTFTVEGACRT